jgi:hypothetical protein
VIPGGGGGGAMPTGTGAYTSGAYHGGAAAPRLAPAPQATAQPQLRLVPDPVPAPAMTPQALPWTDVVPLVSPLVRPSDWLSPTPNPYAQPWPQSWPQPQPDEPPSRCPPGTHRITWPFPLWTMTGYGDSGATSGLYDVPPTPLLVRRRSPRRSRAERSRYVRNNIAALAPLYYNRRLQGAIHHKVPLYVSGPDTHANMVFLPNVVHTLWHNQLARQGRTGWMIRDPYGTVYCVL